MVSSKAAKEAYLRRHGLGKPRASHEGSGTEDEQPATPTREKRPSREEGEKSWAQKRKEHVLARASGSRNSSAQSSAREEEVNALNVSLAAVQFAAKLKKKAQQEKAREPGELTWKEKRVRSYQVTHGVASPRVQEPTEVALGAVLFAAKMMRMRAAAAGDRPADGVVLTRSADGADAAGDAAAGVAATVAAAKAKAQREAAGELSWSQKRKAAYLRKYGRARPEEAAATDVAVSAVTFAARLKARKSKAAETGPPTQALVAGAGSGAAEEGV